MNYRLCKDRLNLLRSPLDSGAISLIILGKYAKTLRNKKTKTVYWIIQGDDFNTNSTSKVLNVLPEILDETNIVMCIFHLDD